MYDNVWHAFGSGADTAQRLYCPIYFSKAFDSVTNSYAQTSKFPR